MKVDNYLTELGGLLRLHVPHDRAVELVVNASRQIGPVEADPVAILGPPSAHAQSLARSERSGSLPTRAIAIGFACALLTGLGMAAFILLAGGSPIIARELPTPVAIGVLFGGVGLFFGASIRDMFRFGTSWRPLAIYGAALVIAFVVALLIQRAISDETTIDIPGGRALGAIVMVATFGLLWWLNRPLRFAEGSGLTSTFWGKVKRVAH